MYLLGVLAGTWKLDMRLIDLRLPETHNGLYSPIETQRGRFVQLLSVQSESGSASTSASFSQRHFQCQLTDMWQMSRFDKEKFSESFTINGYAMCVGIIRWRFDDIFFISLWLDPPMTDDRPTWPMAMRMRITMLGPISGNQNHTQEFCHTTSKTQIDYNKPKDEKVCINDSKFGFDYYDFYEVEMENAVFVTVEIL